MIREQEFKNFYKDDLVHSLVYTEKDRKAIVLQLLLSAILPLILIPTCVFIYIETKQELVLIPAIVLLIGPPIYINYLLGNTIFYKNFKKKIIGKIIKYISPTLDYDNLNKVDDAEYDNSEFFTNKSTVVYGDDHVAGKLNGVKIQFSEFLAEFKNKLDQKAASNKYQFRGLFFVTEFDKNFPCNVLLKTAALPWPDEDEDFEIGNGLFDKLFYIKVLKGRENIHRTLTKTVVDSLLSIQHDIHNEFMISFVDNKVYFAIYHDEDLFEPTIFQTMMNQDKIKGYFDDLFFPIIFLETITKEFK
ncbi:MAG: DUF3137 domain-containing protein [Cytophagales bacterium]